MDIIWIIIAIPIAILVMILFSFIIGNSFRQWNAGDRYKEENSKISFTTTLLIGFLIFIAVGYLLSKCEG